MKGFTEPRCPEGLSDLERIRGRPLCLIAIGACVAAVHLVRIRSGDARGLELAPGGLAVLSVLVRRRTLDGSATRTPRTRTDAVVRMTPQAPKRRSGVGVPSRAPISEAVTHPPVRVKSRFRARGPGIRNAQYLAYAYSQMRPARPSQAGRLLSAHGPAGRRRKRFAQLDGVPTASAPLGTAGDPHVRNLVTRPARIATSLHDRPVIPRAVWVWSSQDEVRRISAMRRQSAPMRRCPRSSTRGWRKATRQTLIRTERSFDSSVDEVRAARLFAQDAVADWGMDPDDAVLVVGELAANAQRHARSEFNVSLDHSEGALLVEVTDASPDIPEIIDFPPDAKSGRGLVIVDRVARAWGIRVIPTGGKTVWVELDDCERTQGSRPTS